MLSIIGITCIEKKRFLTQNEIKQLINVIVRSLLFLSALPFRDRLSKSASSIESCLLHPLP